MIKKLLRRWKLLLALLLLAPVVLWGMLQWVAASMLSPESLVRRLEAKYNCRAEVLGTKVNLWSVPATIELQNFSMIPRDTNADNAVPLNTRQALPGLPETGFGVVNARLEFNPWALLKGSLDIERISMTTARLKSEESEAGVGSVQILLQKPAIVDGKPNPALVASPGPVTTTEEKAKAPFSIKQLPFAANVREVKLEGLRLDHRSNRKRNTISFQDTRLLLSDLQLDPSNLRTSNHAKMELVGTFFFLGKRKFEHLKLNMTAALDCAPLDPATGQLGSIPFVLTLEKDSRFQDLPALQRVSEKMKRWEKYGLKFQALPDDAVVLETAPVSLNYTGSVLRVDSDFVLVLDNYEVALLKGSVMDTENDDCKMEIRMTGSDSISKQALRDFSASLTDKFGDKLGPTLYAKVVSVFQSEGLLRENGTLSIPMGLHGKLSKPDVQDRVTDILEDALLKSIIPGL
jgi:hypothetical protein